MTIINIESTHGFSRLEIIDNPFTKKYIERLRASLEVYKPVARHHIYGVWFAQPPSVAKKFLTEQHQKFMAVINELNDMGTNFPIECDIEILLKRDTESQKMLNRLHRAFTTAQRSRREPVIKWSDRYPSEITVPAGKEDRFAYLIEQINELVHRTELWCRTERRSLGPQLSIPKQMSVTHTDIKSLPNQVEFYTDFYENEGTRVPGDSFFRYEPDDYKYASDSNEFDVWVGKDILGKDYLVAWFEHDDAGEWDVTHSIGHTSRFAVDIWETKRADYINSDDFRNWLSEGGVEYSPKICGIPLGYVIEGHDLIEIHVKNLRPWNDVKITIE